MVMELVDLVVPVVGQPVVEVLKLIYTAVTEMQESSELCTSVHEQLVLLHSKLQEMERKGTLPTDGTLLKYARLVGEYLVFLEKHKRRVWAYRIVLYKYMLAKVRDFQQSIATIMFALSMCHIGAAADERVAAANERKAMAEFRAEQKQFWMKQQRAIAMRLTDDATLAKEVAHEVQQLEALNVFRYELQMQTAGRSVASTKTEAEPETTGADPHDDDGAARVSDVDPSARVLRTALGKVMRRSSVHVASVPGWFLPPHKVEYEAQAFARGSFGTVHYGTMGIAAVVVKCLLIDTRGNENVTSKFRHEAGLWFGFRHKHVLTMYGACDVSSPPFIVCERAVHGNLYNFLSKESNRSMTLRLLLEAASGLAYLHEQRVVHGDLKCDNILVADGYVAKVADFSFSYVRTLSASKQSVANAAILTGGGAGAATSTAGALRWRAPECLKGRRPTFASDVFSFGMCIVEAVSQELPWGFHVDDDTVRDLVKSGELPEQPEHVSDRVWMLVERMCSFKPTDRPSLETVLADLQELAREQATVVTPQAPTASTAYGAEQLQLDILALDLDDVLGERQGRLAALQAKDSPVSARDSRRAIAEEEVAAAAAVREAEAAVAEAAAAIEQERQAELRAIAEARELDMRIAREREEAERRKEQALLHAESESESRLGDLAQVSTMTGATGQVHVIDIPDDISQENREQLQQLNDLLLSGAIAQTEYDELVPFLLEPSTEELSGAALTPEQDESLNDHRKQSMSRVQSTLTAPFGSFGMEGRRIVIHDGFFTCQMHRTQILQDDNYAEYTVYVLRCDWQPRNAAEPTTWLVSHRFSVFEHLHKDLTQRIPATVASLPNFPRKHRLGGVFMRKTGNTSEIVEERKRGLENYLSQVLDICARLPETLNVPELDRFLNLSRQIEQYRRQVLGAAATRASDASARYGGQLNINAGGAEALAAHELARLPTEFPKAFDEEELTHMEQAVGMLNGAIRNSRGDLRRDPAVQHHLKVCVQLLPRLQMSANLDNPFANVDLIPRAMRCQEDFEEVMGLYNDSLLAVT